MSWFFLGYLVFYLKLIGWSFVILLIEMLWSVNEMWLKCDWKKIEMWL